MAYFLAKSEPAVYSIEDLERDRKTVWDGVRNPQAVNALRAMTTGDYLFIYHSGGESAVAGLARVTSPSRPDPKDPKSAVVDLEFVCRIDPRVSLQEIKKSGQFNDWALVRQSRLSTMAAPESFVTWMRQRNPAARIP